MLIKIIIETYPLEDYKTFKKNWIHEQWQEFLNTKINSSDKTFYDYIFSKCNQGVSIDNDFSFKLVIYHDGIWNNSPRYQIIEYLKNDSNDYKV